MNRTNRLSVVAITILAALSGQVNAEDTVIYKTGQDGSGRAQTRGEIVEFTGEDLRIRQTSGRQNLIPTEKVIEIRSPWTPQQTKGDTLFAEGKFSEAIEQYTEAVRIEHRIWAKRKILAKQVWCLRATKNFEQACVVFLSIVGNDPTTQYFDSIPLAWMTKQPNLNLERRAKTWLADDSEPVEQLIAASWLLSTGERGVALAALGRLANDRDPRIAHLASAQRWRTISVIAKPDDVDRWQKQVTRMPSALRAGPNFIVAQTLARQEQHEKAALAFMQVAIFFPNDRELVAASLHRAGLELEQLGREPEAVGLYREVASGYADVAVAAEATGRLEALTNGAEDKK